MRIAGVQMDVALANVPQNLERISRYVADATASGAKLVIFPECAATGYCFDSADEAREFAQPIPGPITETVQTCCRKHDCFVVFGMLEAAGEKIFNAAVLVGPQGVIGSYRKVHLPYLGIDMFTAYGDRPFAVHEAGGVRIGMLICYDAAFPEATRCLALAGVDIVVLPTNWPPGAECMAQCSIRSRAMENGIYFAAVNRVGTERGFPFIGMSSICAPNGDVLAAPSGVKEEIFYADIDTVKSRRKRVIRVPDKHEIDRFADRRPELYGPLLAPHSYRTPRQDHNA
ncbi:MAG: carbon-nitrogen hydrolase family protein [Planctomycetaceae bacterium]